MVQIKMLRLLRRGRDLPCRMAGIEPTVDKKLACLQRREWHSGPLGAIERLQVESFVVRVAAGLG